MLNIKDILNDEFNKNTDLKKITPEESNDLKYTLLEATKDIQKTCEDNNLDLFLVGGSLLGAVRHGGFIPWDDDIDFGMKRDDYEKLKVLLNTQLSDRYDYRCPNSEKPGGNRFLQIFKRDTVLKTFDTNPKLAPEAICIDVFPYDYAPDSAALRLLKGLYSNFLMLIAASVTRFKYPNKSMNELLKRSFKGRASMAFNNLVGFMFSWKSPKKWFDLVDKTIQGKKSHFITSATGRKHYLGEIFPISVFYPLKKIKFESLEILAPNRAEDYLASNYGENYLEVPPVDKRESHFIKELRV